MRSETQRISVEDFRAPTSKAPSTRCGYTILCLTAANIASLAAVTPTVATAAAASPSTVTGTTTALSVLGSDASGAANLTYTWAATSVPAGATAPTFSANGSNAAKNTVTTLSKAGSYTFTVTMVNGPRADDDQQC